MATERAKGQLDAYRPSAPPLKRSHRGFSILSYSGLKARHPVSPWLAQRRRAKTAICFDAITLRHETTYVRSGRFAHKDAQKCFSSVARLWLNNRERCRFCACLAQLITRSRHNADSTVRRFRNASATAPLFCLGGIPIDGRFSWHSPEARLASPAWKLMVTGNSYTGWVTTARHIVGKVRKAQFYGFYFPANQR